MKRIDMREIRDALRLHHQGLSPGKIAASIGAARSTVQEYIGRAKVAGLSWPLPDDLLDTDLERQLYPRVVGEARSSIPVPDWSYVHSELRRDGVTLQLLWIEYREVYKDGYGYSRFCELYTKWEGKLSPVMRQRHTAGERLFVDYAGATIDIIDPKTGEVRAAQIFVAALGASNYTYAEATWTQQLSDWISSHVRAFEYFGGVTSQVVCDNLKSGVTKACFYEPEINRTYEEMARHYDVAIIPARPRKPKDKSKVEVGVQVTERWILARLRNRQFFSLEEANAAIRILLDQLNNKVTRHLGASRRELFEKLDKPALKSLPKERYVYAEWKSCRAGVDYHVELKKHYYSVPYQLMKKVLWARITPRTVEIYHNGQRVASHARSSGNRQHTTIADHMPANHRHMEDGTPERIRRYAKEIGPNVLIFVEVLMKRRRHSQQGYRSCMGVIRLAGKYGNDRLDAACVRALEINTLSYSSLNSILNNSLDRRNKHRTMDEGPAITHENIRGAQYFH